MVEPSSGTCEKLRLNLSGQFEALLADGNRVKFRTKKTAALLAYLGYFAGRSHNRDHLAAVFWPDSGQQAARQSLRMALTGIRSSLGKWEHILVADRDSVGLDADLVDTDVARVVALLEQSAPDFSASLEALASIKGALLQGFEEDWILAEWLCLIEQCCQVATLLSHCARSSEEATRAVPALRALLNVVGLREDLYVALIKLHKRSGSDSQAIAAFEELERRLDEEWGEPPSQKALDALGEAAVSGGVTVRSPGATPVLASSELVGRNNEIDDLLALIADQSGPRLVTVHGPGGSGKTTLVMATLEKLKKDFQGPIVTVDCTAIEDADEVELALVEELGAGPCTSQEAGWRIVQVLQGAQALIVLDNLEQLVPAVCPIVGQFVERLPLAKILCTSRIALGLQNENLLTITGLELPTTGLSLAELSEVESVRLLSRRAKAVNPQFNVKADNAASVIALCRKLDGLPLAIELAASRLRTHSPAQVLAHLSRSQSFLRWDGEGRHLRQASLSGAIEWSLGLLSESGKRATLALSVFLGPFTEDVAARFIDSDPTDYLDEAVRSSILQVDTSRESAHFRMLETLREFCIEKLRTEGDYERAMRVHFDWCRSYAEQVRASGLTSVQRAIELSKEADNIFHAAGWCSSGGVPAVEAAGFMKSIARFCRDRGQTDKVAPFYRQILDSDEGTLDSSLRMELQMEWILAQSNSLAVNELQAQMLSMLPIIEQLDNDSLSATFYILYSGNAKVRGDYEESLRLLNRALPYAESTGNPDLIGRVHYNTMLTLCCVGDYVSSLAHGKTALKFARQGDDPDMLVRCLFDTAAEMVHQGEGEGSLSQFEEALVICRKMGARRLEGLTYWQYGDGCVELKRWGQALEVLQHSCRLLTEVGFHSGLKWVFLKTSEALHGLEHHGLATRVLARAVVSREEEARPLAVHEVEAVDRTKASLTEAIGAQRFAGEWAEGAQSTFAELMAEVMAVRPDQPEPK